MFAVKLLALLCAFAAAALAQAHGGWVYREVPAASATAVGLIWEHRLGLLAVDCGCARVLAECRLQRARAAVPDVLSVHLHVDQDVTCIVAVVPAAAESAAIAFIKALLADATPMSDDELLTAIARAALVADDEQFIYPGGVLRARSLARQWPWAAQGDSATMASMTPTQVRAWLCEPTMVAGEVRGAVSPTLRAALGQIEFPQSDEFRNDENRKRGDDARYDISYQAAGGVRQELHSRVDQPFVMAAFWLACFADRPALAVGLEVAKARAVRRFRVRGSELRAHTPVVAWSWLAGDEIVRFHRQGEQPAVLLRGEVMRADAAAETAATVAELESFLAELRQKPPTDREVSNARTHLITELGLAAFTTADGEPAVCGGRLMASLLGGRRRVDKRGIENVTPASAHAAIVYVLSPANAYWHALLPAARPDRGWRQR